MISVLASLMVARSPGVEGHGDWFDEMNVSSAFEFEMLFLV
jgi:hypothetical protein